LHVAFVRRIGPYELVDPDEYATLLAWVGRRGLDAIGLIGIAHDAPGITPAARLRFDVGVHVTSPFQSTREVSYQLLSERWSAATSYVGPFSGLAAAYERAFRAASELRGFDVLGLPVEERYLTTRPVTHSGTKAGSVSQRNTTATGRRMLVWASAWITRLLPIRSLLDERRFGAGDHPDAQVVG
jgi:DNA gyrase inhibitor GyrI